MVGQKRSRRRSPGERLQDWRFNLDEAALGHEGAQRVHRLRTRDEQFACALVGEQVELAVAVAGAGVAKPVALVGRWPQRLGQQYAAMHAERQLPTLGYIDRPLRFDDVADVEVHDTLVGLLAKRILAHRQLDLPREVAQVDERRLAVSAPGDDAPGEAIAEVGVLAGLELR